MTDDHRCSICGLLHPLVTVCPYIQEQEIREEYSAAGGRRRLQTRIVRTRYFRRPEIAAASLATAEDEDGDGPEVEAQAAQP